MGPGHTPAPIALKLIQLMQTFHLLHTGAPHAYR